MIATGVGQIIKGTAVVAVIDWVADAATKLLSAAQTAVRRQFPDPAVIVTVVPETEHGPLTVIAALVVAFVVATAEKVAS